MEQYISKAALVAEIKRRIKYDEMVMDHDAQITELLSRELNTLYELSFFIKSLEAKDVNLEKEMNDYFVSMDIQEHENIFESTFRQIAKHFFRLGMQQSKKLQ